MLHLGAWALALGASAAVVVGRVAMPARETAGTVAAVAAPPAHTTTVTRTVVETVRVRQRRRHAAPRRRAASQGRAPRRAAGRPVAQAAPAPARRRGQPKAAPSAPKASQPQPSGPQTVDGDAVDTRYGVVQVRLVLDGSRVTDVIALAAPDDVERSRQITADAVPRLRQEVLSAQSAQIDAVAGATYTSQGYRQSAQSALDLA